MLSELMPETFQNEFSIYTIVVRCPTAHATFKTPFGAQFFAARIFSRAATCVVKPIAYATGVTYPVSTESIWKFITTILESRIITNHGP
jgi:hypothetical protein